MPKAAKTVTDEDIRRKYYESAGYSMWITEMQLDPLQLVVSDDETGKRFRVPVAMNKGELTFGDPVEVAVQYVDASAARQGSAIVFASRDDSLEGLKPPSPSAPLVDLDALREASEQEQAQKAPGAGVNPAQEAVKIHQAAVRSKVLAATQTPAADLADGLSLAKGADGMPDREKIREALGLAPSATDAQIQEAWASAWTPAPTPAPTPTAEPVTPPTQATPPAAPAPAAADLGVLAAAAARLGVQIIDPGQLDEMRAMASRGQQAYEERRRDARDTLIEAAVQKGKIALSRRDHWVKAWDADPEGTRSMLEAMAPNLVPMEADGYAGSVASSEAEQTYFSMYPEDKPKGARR